jgi:hypothetical protein
MIKLYLAIFLCLILANVINAGVFPTEPIGKTVYVPKSKVTIKWKDDDVVPSIKNLKTVTVDLMTGDDFNHITLDTVGAVAASAKKLGWTVPEVDPAGQWYFLKFTSGKNNFFTTRFTITDRNGKFPDPPPGKNPGKVGKIVDAKNPKATPPAKPAAPTTSTVPKDDDNPNKVVETTATESPTITPAAVSVATATTPVIISSHQQLFFFTILLCSMITFFI